MVQKILACALSIFLFGVVNAQQTEKIYLSGIDFEHPVEWDFMVTGGMNANQWSKINVPSQWELEGFGEYTYGRWYKERGKSPSKEEGFYKYKFDVDESLEGKEIDIVFGGAMTDTEVKINGTIAGEVHQGGFYQFEYRITDLVKYGEENLLEVHVKKHSDDRLVNAAERKADWWLFGGIYRPVWLEVVPESNIDHFAVDAKSDGSFYADLRLQNVGSKSTIKASIEPLIGDGEFETVSFDIEKGITETSIETKWDGVKTWSPEDPNLYVLTLKLLRKGELMHEVSKRIGFRTIEFKKRDGIYVNGVKTVFKGINRHTFWPESGRSTSKRISLMDAELLKDMNINAVRTHYPPDPHFLDMCDSLGLFFLDELAGWQNSYNTKVGSKLVKEMIERDVNHPSIILWDNGNEGGWNYNVDHLFQKYDPQDRIVVHPWADFNGWDLHHYPAYQTGVHRFENGENVYFPGEFMHGMYDQGHGAGLHDFWAKLRSSPLNAGGFMWAYNDCAVLRSDWKGDKKYDSNNYMAPDGIVGPYREKEGSYFTVKEVWAPIQFKPRMINSSFDGSFVITNTYLATNLNTCKMEYELVTISDENGTKSSKVTETGSIQIPSIDPDESRKIKMNVSDQFFENDVVRITAWDKYGKEIYSWTWPIHRADYFAEKLMPVAEVSNKAISEETDATITLKANGVEVTFNKENGYITKVVNAEGEVPFNNGPIPLGMDAKVVGAKVKKVEDGIELFVDYIGGIDYIKWLMTDDGRLKMHLLCLTNYRNDGSFDGAFIQENIKNFGVTFSYPEEIVTGMEWFGKGPYRVWKNRVRGTTFNLWNKEYNNTITGESFENLIYPEFKGYHANMLYAQIQTKESPISFYSESDKMFFRVFTPVEPVGRDRRTMPVFPEGDLSFLYEIPAIRSFKPIEHHGPQSQPSSIRIKSGDDGVSMKVWFDFRGE